MRGTRGNVVRMKITLDDVTPAVVRTIAVPLDIRLDRLHTVFQAAFGWTDTHLWEMFFGRTGFGIPDFDYGFDGPLDARKSTLEEVLADTRRRTFRYVYDFGDNWEHSVRIESVAPADPQLSYPLLLAATGERPPEDSGGPFGYADLVEALGNPEHDYHEEATERLGEDHDPNAQPDTELIERDMADLAKAWLRKKRGVR